MDPPCVTGLGAPRPTVADADKPALMPRVGMVLFGLTRVGRIALEGAVKTGAPCLIPLLSFSSPSCPEPCSRRPTP
jgi:hypothetical protein